MSSNRTRSSGTDEDDVQIPDEYPDPDWTPKQQENWKHGEPVYNELETEAGREFYRRTWRPKKRDEGMMERDHVKLGTPEDYVREHVDSYLSPWGDMTSVFMRKVGTMKGNSERMETAIDDILQAKCSVMPDEKLARILESSKRVAQLYGADTESDN